MLHSCRQLLIALGLTLASTQLYAETPDSNTTMPDRAELEAALKECAASIDTDSSGRPDHSAMDSCMTAKGFSKPSAPPGHGGPGGSGGYPPPER
ncbi:MAG: hypothetical protein ABW098_10645 [Candidatus Thiodiazotropha sp.]